MICIYIRSLDQARGLLAQGVLVFPNAVSSDCRNTSPGQLCTACICPWKLSTLKLSCRLSLSDFILWYSVLYFFLPHHHVLPLTSSWSRKSSFPLLLLTPYIVLSSCWEDSYERTTLFINCMCLFSHYKPTCVAEAYVLIMFLTSFWSQYLPLSCFCTPQKCCQAKKG